jgi:hypothetical protein
MRVPSADRTDREGGEHRRDAPASFFSPRTRRLVPLGAALLVSVLVFSSLAGALANPASGARPSGADLAAAATGAASRTCYNINATICLSMQNSTEPDILPALGSHVSSVEPNPSTTISLYVESKYDLVWSTAHYTGALSPISLNMTGVLWNGVQYYNANDSSTWHPPGTSWWAYGPTGQNTTYPYWYEINFTAKTALGTPSFFPGMTATWWVYIVSNNSGILSHFSSVYYRFTFAGAWPYSPYRGAAQYAGAAAATEDVSATQSPLVPNYNDSVLVTIATTSADLITGATIGGAYLDLTEYATDGALLHQMTLNFQVVVSNGVGRYSVNVTLPASLAQNPGALVEYQITSWDTNIYGPDQVVSPTYNYTVNGNGTFTSGVFADDLLLTSTPIGPSVGGSPPPLVPEGQPVKVLVTSRNAGTSILTAELVYSFTYTPIGENTTQDLTMARLNSTNFVATIPAMPLNATVNFVVYAWDFAQDRDVSRTYTYQTPTLASALASVPSNSTFFLTYVYDVGQHAWVTGASVEVQGTSGYLHVTGTTFLGVTYPNATARPYVPLYLPADESYEIWVNDSNFRPVGSSSAPSVAVKITPGHNLDSNGILAVASDYQVAESGNAIYFWLNESPSGTTFSPTDGGIDATTALAAAIGLIALALVAIPLTLWWGKIRARRQKEERRITL